MGSGGLLGMAIPFYLLVPCFGNCENQLLTRQLDVPDKTKNAMEYESATVFEHSRATFRTHTDTIARINVARMFAAVVYGHFIFRDTL